MKSLLIIEDDEMMLSALSTFFERESYTVVATTNAARGTELYTTHRPDAVLLGLNNPSIPGLELLYKIQQLDPGARIVINTGYASPDMVRMSKNKKNVAFYANTSDVDVLRDRIAEVIAA